MLFPLSSYGLLNVILEEAEAHQHIDEYKGNYLRTSKSLLDAYKIFPKETVEKKPLNVKPLYSSPCYLD